MVEANNTPIYGTYPGYTNGDGKVGIEIELFFDYLCSACQGENPVINELLTTEWLDGTVADQIFVRYTPYPLPYHVHSYEVARLVPYFMNMCIDDSTKCFSNDYRNYSFEQLETVLGMKDTSKDDFLPWWSKQVGEKFEISSTDIEAALNDRQTDLDVRAMWKYGSAKGVHGTPTAFVNGAYLDNVPFNVDDWMTLLNSIYDSQHHAPTQ